MRFDPLRFDSRTIDPNSKSLSVGWMMLRCVSVMSTFKCADTLTVAELAHVREQLFALHALRLQRVSEQIAHGVGFRHRRNGHRARRQRSCRYARVSHDNNRQTAVVLHVADRHV